MSDARTQPLYGPYIVAFEVKCSSYITILYHAHVCTLLVSKYVLANTLRLEQKEFPKNLDGTGQFVRKQMVAELLETEKSETLHMQHVFIVARQASLY